MKKIILLGILIVLSTNFLNAQRGKDGSKTITGNEVVNAYTTLTSDANLGVTSITVANSNLNTNFSGNLSAGDLIMIIQVQGTFVEDTLGSQSGAVNPLDSSSQFFSTWGRIIDYMNCGNYELAQVKNAANSSTINLDCPLSFNYTASGKVIVLRVPRYSDLTINSGGNLTANPWNGSTGGVLAIEVDGITTINSGGKIDVSEIGFRGGQPENSSIAGGQRFAANNALEGGEKGEGISGDQVFYDAVLHGRYCKGAAANAGGGGTSVSAGGGGGSNAGNPSNWNKGIGVPDPSFNTAWALESPSIAMINSSGGGRGGYTHTGSNENPMTKGPGHPDWGGDGRRNNGGLGGRPLDYSTGKIFMGGAGGAGDGNENPISAGSGGKGGGIIFISSFGNVIGSGNIIANGQNGFNSGSTAPAPFNTVTGTDGAGGAGSGGTIVIKSPITASTLSLEANGGNGGLQILRAGAFASIGEVEGPGGGGGGGYIAITSGTPTRATNGGANGTTDSPYMSNFPPNGATGGGTGMPTETIPTFDITVNDATICTNTTTTLTASITGTAPAGPIFEWYDAPTGGNLLFTGNPFITSSLSVTDTFYVSVCPAPYRVASIITVTTCGQALASFTFSNDTICLGDSITFTDNSTGSNINAWNWNFQNGTPSTANNQGAHTITFNTVGQQNINLSITDDNGTDDTTIVVMINVLPNVIASIDTSICDGDQVNLSVTGADTYNWDNSLGAGQTQTSSPTSLTTYHVTGTDLNGCVNTDSVIVTINALPNVIANATVSAICTGDTVSVYGIGANTYTWNNSVTNGTVFNPTNTLYYTVIGTDINSCTFIDSVEITVNNCTQPIASFTLSDDTICLGNVITFTDNSTGSNVSAWSWTFQNGTPTSANTQGAHTITFNTVGQQNINLSITDDNGAHDTTIVVMINALPNIITGVDTSICYGDQVNLSADGADTYNWDNSLGTGQTQTSSPTSLTTYHVTGTDLNGCINTDSVIVTINALPTVIANATVSTICSGDTVSVYGTGANTYTWNNSVTNGTVFNPTNTLYYTVIGTDINSCTFIDSVEITVNNCTQPIASFTLSDDTICLGNVITFTDNSTGSNVSAWSWTFQNGTPTSANTQGAHTITFNTIGQQNINLSITDDNSTHDTTIVVMINALPNVIATSSNPIICLGDSVILIGTGANTYQWFNNLGQTQNDTIFPIQDALYIVQGTDLNGCQGADNLIITVNFCTSPTPLFTSTDTSPCIDACIDFTDNSTDGTPTAWSWQFFGANTTTSNIQNPANICYDSIGTFDVALVTSNVFGSDSLFIPNYITVDSCNINPSEIIIPNVFSPNGDGNNDLFSVSGTGIISAKIAIYNRWGSLLFNTENLINVGWDGRTSSGTETAAGTYFYIIDVETVIEIKTYKGTVTLVR